jgi:hypothetical protein
MSQPYATLLIKGEEVLVDDADLPFASQHKWRLQRIQKSKTFVYAVTGVGVYLHRLITQAGPGQLVDHINHNTLDNRRSNLRLCTHSQNLVNRHKYRGTSTSHIGIWYDAGDRCKKRWVAYVQQNGGRTRKRFATEQEAVAWRLKENKRLHGEFCPI